jgi:hypothetical protein
MNVPLHHLSNSPAMFFFVRIGGGGEGALGRMVFTKNSTHVLIHKNLSSLTSCAAFGRDRRGGWRREAGTSGGRRGQRAPMLNMTSILV